MFSLEWQTECRKIICAGWRIFSFNLWNVLLLIAFDSAQLFFFTLAVYSNSKVKVIQKMINCSIMPLSKWIPHWSLSLIGWTPLDAKKSPWPLEITRAPMSGRFTFTTSAVRMHRTFNCNKTATTMQASDCLVFYFGWVR